MVSYTLYIGVCVRISSFHLQSYEKITEIKQNGLFFLVLKNTKSLIFCIL